MKQRPSKPASGGVTTSECETRTRPGRCKNRSPARAARPAPAGSRSALRRDESDPGGRSGNAAQVHATDLNGTVVGADRPGQRRATPCGSHGPGCAGAVDHPVLGGRDLRHVVRQIEHHLGAGGDARRHPELVERRLGDRLDRRWTRPSAALSGTARATVLDSHGDGAAVGPLDHVVPAVERVFVRGRHVVGLQVEPHVVVELRRGRSGQSAGDGWPSRYAPSTTSPTTATPETSAVVHVERAQRARRSSRSAD